MKLTFKNKRKAFTLIELLIVIAIIGILFIVLVSKVDFATDKAKTTGVQTDFRSFQMAFETVAREYTGFNTLGWDIGDTSDDALWSGKTTPDGQAYTYTNKDKDAGDRVRNSYDVGDANLNGELDNGETWTGRKFYTETWTSVYTLDKPGNSDDKSAYIDLETAINKNLDPKLHITIDPDTKTFTMKNGYQDPWKTEYHGFYLSNATIDQMDRGAIIMYSDGPNKTFGSAQTISNGVVAISIPGNNVAGQDDLSIMSIYTYVNGYGEIISMSTGFSQNQSMLAGGNSNNKPTITPVVPSEPNYNTLSGGLYATGSNYQTMLYSWQELIDMGIILSYTNGVAVGSNKDLLAGDLVLNDTITSIRSQAFYECTNLTGIVIPDSVVSLGSQAFYRCSSLKSVKLSKNIKTIPANCFVNCSSLSDINLNYINNIETYGLSGCGFTTLTLPSNIKVLGVDAFSFCNSLTMVDMSDLSIQTMGARVFYSCKNLETIILPPTLLEISEDAFAYDKNLKNITIPNNVTKIGNYAFSQCSSLVSLTLPSNLKEIGTAVFRSCTSLQNVTLPDSINKIGVNAFTYSKIEQIIVPQSITVINESVFSFLDELKTITIHNNITSINARALAYNYDLKEIVYLGTMAEWNNITKGENWDDKSGLNNGASRYSIKCTDGTMLYDGTVIN